MTTWTPARPPWLADAWRLWRRDPVLWSSAGAAFVLAAALLGRIPYLGVTLAAGLTPIALGGLMLTARALDAAARRQPGAGPFPGGAARALFGGLADEALAIPLIGAALAGAVASALLQLGVLQVSGGAAAAGSSLGAMGIAQIARLAFAYGLALAAYLALAVLCLQWLACFLDAQASPGEALGCALRALAGNARTLAVQAGALALPVMAAGALLHGIPVLGVVVPALLASVLVPLLVASTHLGAGARR